MFSPLAVPKIVGRDYSSLTILTAAPFRTRCIIHWMRSCSMPEPGFNRPQVQKSKRKNRTHHNDEFGFGPSDRSRTCGLLNPIQALYQTGLHPGNATILTHLYQKCKHYFQFFLKFLSTCFLPLIRCYEE